jgi:hypothetical protein
MSSIGGFLLPGLLFAWLKFPGGDYLRLNTRLYIGILFLAIVLLVVASPFISLTYEINQLLDLPSSMNDVEKTNSRPREQCQPAYPAIDRYEAAG